VLFSRLLQGKVADALRSLKHHPAFRRARFQIRSGRGEATHLLIGIGQIHPVLHGRFERFQARKIAKTQAWIFHACTALREQINVTSFGEEGLWAGGDGSMLRISDELLRPWRDAAKDHEGVQSFLRKTAQRWRRALKRGNQRAAQTEATALNGLALLQALDPQVSVFAYERREIHGVIGAQIAGLHRDIDRIESSAAYQSVRTKNGRGLTRAEYEAAVKRHLLIKAFNKVLLSPERDRLIFKDLLKVAAARDVTVFILGQGHRIRQLRLAKDNLPPGTVFCWITPPQLWFWEAMLRWITVAIVVSAGLGILIWSF
jgi:hypothetical protein